MSLKSGIRQNIDTRKKKLVAQLGQDWVETLYIGTPYVAGILIIALLGLAGNWATKKLYNRQDAQVAAGIAQAPEIDLNSPDAKALLLSSYIELNGGSKIWSEVEGISYNGIIFNDLEHHSFVASQSKDGSLSLRITNRAAETQLEVQNGHAVWTPEQAPGQKPAYSVVSIAHLAKDYYSPLIDMAVSDQGEITEMKEIIWQNMPIIAVKVQSKNGDHSELYLYEKDLTLVQRIDYLNDGTTQKYRFSSYDKVHGLRVPTMVRAENDRGDISNIRFTDIKPVIQTDVVSLKNTSDAARLLATARLQ